MTRAFRLVTVRSEASPRASAPSRRSGAVEVGWCFTLTPHRTGCSVAATSLRERSRSIPDPMPAVVRRCGLARPAAGEQAAWLVAVPDRDGERPAAVPSTLTCMPARNSSRPATLTRTYRTASHRSATCLVACPVLPEGPAVPGSGTYHQEGDQDPGSRHRRVAAQGDLAIPPAVQAARAVLGKRAGSQQVGVPRDYGVTHGPTMLRQPWRRQAHRPARCGRIRCRRVHRPPAAPGQGARTFRPEHLPRPMAPLRALSSEPGVRPGARPRRWPAR